MSAGLFTPEEYALFERCDEFLWRVRCHMHFVTKRAEERLSFGLQPRIAERFGYEPRGGLSGVERFMKAYFRIAKDVGDLTAIVCAELEARHAKRTRCSTAGSAGSATGSGQPPWRRRISGSTTAG